VTAQGGARRAVWTDFGGVLTPPVAQTLARYCAQIGVPVEAFGAAMRAVAADAGVVDVMAPLDTPLMDQRTWERAMEDALADQGLSAQLADFPSRWFADRSTNQSWVAALRALRARGVFVGLLSNMPPAWDRYWRATVAPDGLFDDVVLSFEVGCRKPEPAVFALAAARAGTTPDRCLLVDDLEPNCAAAREAGWHAVRFESTPQAEQALGALLRSSDPVPVDQEVHR